MNVNTLIDDRFSTARDSLITVVRENLADQEDELKAVRTWLDQEFSEQVVRQILESKFDDHRKRALGQMTPPDSRYCPRRPKKNCAVVADKLRVDRLEAAFSQLHAENHRGDGLRLLGSNVPRAERFRNALRVVVISACIIDPDVGEYLETVTALAETPWLGGSGAASKTRGRSELLRRWGWISIEMLAEACKVLGWMTRSERSDAPAIDDKPLNRKDLLQAVASAQDRWPTLLDALVYLCQRCDVLLLKPNDPARTRGTTECIGEPWAFAMQRIWKLLGLSTPRNGAEFYDYIVACASSAINDSTVNRIVAPALRELDTADVRRSLWLALFNKFPHIGHEILAEMGWSSSTPPGDSKDSSNDKTKRRGMSLDEANIKARDYLRKYPNATARDVEKNVGCALGRVSELPAWQAVMEQRRAGRTPKSPKVITLTADLGKNVDQQGHVGRRIGTSPKEDNADQTLQELITEHQEDFEPSPVDDSPSRPTRARRKL